MRAIIFDAPRKLHLVDDVPMPEMGDGSILIRCTHAGLCGSNVGPYTGDGYWAEWAWPQPVGYHGHENVGVIVESSDANWPEGTMVLAQSRDYNGFVEYFVPNPRTLARLPDVEDVGSYVIAQPLATVMRAVGRIPLVTAQRCAVVGQGPIGLMFTFLLSQAAPNQLIAVDKVPWRLEWARRLGATHVVDASSEDTVEAVRDLTGGAMLDVCVEAAGRVDALCTAAFLPRRQGRLMIFGVPHHEYQVFPWMHVTAMETELITSRGGRWYDFMPIGIERLGGPWSVLREMVAPQLPWEQAAEAFEMYAFPAQHDGALKVTLLL
jgi:(R,R)-butanediol dehydrogenase/meso-butanediol dehydrogenase/diacetyl reductase/L-iditol 2-dehydrogenase